MTELEQLQEFWRAVKTARNALKTASVRARIVSACETVRGCRTPLLELRGALGGILYAGVGREAELSLVVALRCASCGRGFSVPAGHLRKHLHALLLGPRPSAGFVALTCSNCGSGGKSAHDDCLVAVRLTRADVPQKGDGVPEKGHRNGCRSG